MSGIKILATGSCKPALTITNDDLKKCIDTNDEWIHSRTGISTRRMTNGEPTWYIGAAAAKQALERAKLSPEKIDMIICTTITGDYFTPSCAAVIGREIGAVGCPAFDISAACSGFVYALDIAQKYLASGAMKNVLVVSAERLSTITNFTDRSSCILFGDGAAAAVVTSSDKFYSSYMGCDGTGMKYLYAKADHRDHPFTDSPVYYDDQTSPDAPVGVLVQDGKEVYKFATKALPHALMSALEGTGRTVDDIDIIVPHQANIRIIETAAKNLGLPMEKFFVNIEHSGNTSSASIPIALDEAMISGAVHEGQTLGLCGFGAGLTQAAIIMDT
ncbi:MAG: ketoacyl-ACP synthase III [Oscillospiraceae bacterium]|nr:ketoacyl-ACP synthase III [Oscillospiraceae bacterium]